MPRASRPDKGVAVNEPKPLQADSLEEGQVVANEQAHPMRIGEAITRLLEDQDRREIPPLSELRQLLQR